MAREKQAKKCAVKGRLGRYSPKVVGSGEYEVCLSKSQLKHLFHGTKPGKDIGCGMFACVYDRGGKQVVKITRDREDVEGLLASKGMDRVVKVFDIRELPGAGTDVRTGKPIPIYAVVAERLRPLNKKETDWYDKPFDHTRALVLKHAEEYSGPAKKYTLTPADTEAIAMKSCKGIVPTKKCLTFSKEFSETWMQLVRHGIVWVDSHVGNIAFDDKGKWKVIDLGYSGTKKRTKLQTLLGGTGQLKKMRRRVVKPLP